MKITVGKSYEGKSDNFFIPDGDHEFQIVEVKQVKNRVNMTLVTSDGRRAFKTFFLLDKNGQPDDKNMRELADFITTAMQIDDDEAEVDIEDAVGYYIVATIKNKSVDREDGTKKSTYYLNRPKRCDGFSDGTGSRLEEYEEKRAEREARKAKEEAEQASAEEENVQTPPSTIDFDDILG